MTHSKHHKYAFVEDGFGNWKNALQKFCDHEKSDMHRESVSYLAIKNSGQTLLNHQYEEDAKLHREMLLRLLSCVRFLARQGLPFRGHWEDLGR